MFEVTVMNSNKKSIGVGPTSTFDSIKIFFYKYDLCCTNNAAKWYFEELEKHMNYPRREAYYTSEELVLEFDLTHNPIKLQSINQFLEFEATANEACLSVFKNHKHLKWKIQVQAKKEGEIDIKKFESICQSIN